MDLDLNYYLKQQQEKKRAGFWNRLKQRFRKKKTFHAIGIDLELAGAVTSYHMEGNRRVIDDLELFEVSVVPRLCPDCGSNLDTQSKRGSPEIECGECYLRGLLKEINDGKTKID